jgi:hypothetical protein
VSLTRCWPRGQAARGQRPRGTPPRRRPIWCRRAACSGTAAPTRCRTRRWAAAQPDGMDGSSVEQVAAKLRHAPYAGRFGQLFGAGVFDAPHRAVVSEAMFAVARYQIEDAELPSLHQQIRFLAGGAGAAGAGGVARLSAVQRSVAGPIAAAAISTGRPDGLPPLFTDGQFEALGAPRNPALAANRDPTYFDLGICGPYRTDMRDADAVLRHVPDADPAQRGDAAGVLPQRRVPFACGR